MGALVRVTTSPTTFVLLAGDSNHHISLIRPNTGVRLPCDLQHTIPDDLQKVGAPDFADTFVNPAPQNTSIHTDAVAAATSFDKVKRFDARADTWVILSHDVSLLPILNATDGIPLFPATINEWQKKGLKEKSRFLFLEDDNIGNIFINGTLSGHHPALGDSTNSSTTISTGTIASTTTTTGSSSATSTVTVKDDTDGSDDSTDSKIAVTSGSE
jgi:hypothetical protein